MKRLLFGILVFFAAFFAAGCAPSDSDLSEMPWKEGNPDPVLGGPRLTDEDLNRLNRAFVGLSERVSPAVVNIYTTTKVWVGGNAWGSGDPFFDFFFGNPFMQSPRAMERSALGSGFIINAKKGYVLTNAHVVQPERKTAEKIRVKLMGEEHSEGHGARVVGVDPTADVALLQVDGLPRNTAVCELGDSDSISVGEWVLAIGNPYGHTHTVTQGIVSALGRESEINRSNFIQTSASINPGNSGGPLFNIRGQVIGINTAIDARAQGIGFAVPINTAKGIVKQLVETGEIKRGWLGVHIASLDRSTGEALGLKGRRGVLVQEVEPGAPAEKAGVKPYDVITEVDGRSVESSRELSTLIAGHAPGDRVSLVLIRDGKRKKIGVTLGRRPDEGAVPAKESQGQVPASGLRLEAATDSLRRQWRIPEGLNGVVVTAVQPGSPAQEAGLRPGDLILELDRRSVKDPETAARILNRAAEKKQDVLFRARKPSGWSVIGVLRFSES